ncbi:MAG: ribosome-associated translation inhibitor RaiA [Oscillospiraceae bacterium]|nr:ribosome-associated translation inhibitor RaiA [Oscillospiraceae bacterium]
MKIAYTARKVNLKDNFKELCEKKLSKFNKIFSEDATVSVVVTLYKNRQTVEVTVSDNGMIYRAEDTQDEMNDALDKVVDILGRQLRKNKTRLSRRLRDNTADFTAILPDEDIEDEEEFDIRYKTIPVKPISVEEAILQMNMLNHDFFVFINAETNETNVVYKRKGNTYGLLEPEV